jgi:hypothetical protein
VALPDEFIGMTSSAMSSAVAKIVPETISMAPRWRTAMLVPRILLAAPALLLVAAPLPSASVESRVDPLLFFQGRTETVGTVRVMFHKPYSTHSLGQGRIEPDGSLLLVQHVQDDGKPATDRWWRVRETAPGQFTATMSQAVGPVVIDKVGQRYRFRFKLKGNFSAEQMLTPLPSGRAALSNLKVKKMGITVATTDGIVRKI